MTEKKRITVITPCFNEEENVLACRDALREVFKHDLPAYDYEHIFADNASVDTTLEKLTEMAKKDPKVKVIVNSRNVGPFRNTFNALKHASGDAVVVLLAADLQDPPELIVEFVRAWEEGFKVVYGVRRNREEALWLRSLRKIYYRLIHVMANVRIPPDAGEFQLIDRVVLNSLTNADDYYPYLRGMIGQCSFPSKGIDYTWKRRQHGKSNNNMYALIDQALNGFISTSNVPIRLALFSGFVISFLSVLYALVQLILNLFFLDAGAPGVPTLIVGLFFFGGVQLFFIGLLGEYISAIHSQVRREPPMQELKLINFDKDSAAKDAS